MKYYRRVYEKPQAGTTQLPRCTNMERSEFMWHYENFGNSRYYLDPKFTTLATPENWDKD